MEGLLSTGHTLSSFDFVHTFDFCGIFLCALWKLSTVTYLGKKEKKQWDLRKEANKQADTNKHTDKQTEKNKLTNRQKYKINENLTLYLCGCV